MNYVNGKIKISTFIKDGVLMRICCKCGKTFPLNSTFFHRNNNSKSGFRYYCKKCVKHPWIRPRGSSDYKECSDCHIIYPRTEEFFYKDRGHWSGVFSICKSCCVKRSKKRYQKIKNTPKHKSITKKAQEKRKLTKPDEVKLYNTHLRWR